MSDGNGRPPQDQGVRDVVSADLADTLFVEAGAGSGKTTVLVNRVCALIESGVDVRAIAAITFTEKAASELRVRVREKLASQPPTAVVDDALATLGDAPMSTLHAFARRLLTEHGVAVGVPPHFEVLDTVEEAIYLEQQWRRLAGELFDEDGPLATVVSRAAELGLRPKGVRDIVIALHESHDRLRNGQHEWPTTPVTLPPIDLRRVTDAIGATPLVDRPEVAEYLARALAADTEGERIDILRTEGVLPRQGGKLGEPARVVKGVAANLRAQALAALLPSLAATVLRWAEERAAEGRLLFHDLLVLARDALRDPDVRAACRDRYQRILIDEFQDTDPLQIEIAVMLASSRDDIEGREWSDDPLLSDDAGRLFFVGDPKQSIYRFRRADIELYETAQAVFARPPLHLTENFRSVASIVSFVNELFGPWMESPDAIGQPGYTPLTPYVDDHDAAASVVTIGDEIAGVPTAEIRLEEADAVVRVVAQAKREGWQVRDEHGTLRPVNYGDIAILMPTRASLPALDHGLDAAGIPVRVESRILIWNTAEVRDLLAVLSAIADPNDQVSIVAALRSAGLGCSDRDLATWRWGGERPRWRYTDIHYASDEARDHPVGRALTILSDLHRERFSLSIGELVREVVDVCHLRELAFAHVRPRDRWRRIDFFLAQARGFEEAGGASIEEFVSWARDQADRDVWENDSVEPDPDDDAVRVLTVHASKGLEFPIVVLMGLNTQPRSGGPPVLWTDTGFEAKAGPQDGDRFETGGYDGALEREASLLKSERVRLAYVAMTRARDRLVVSRFRPDRFQSLAKEMTSYLPDVPALDPEPLPQAVAVAEGPFDHQPMSERDAWIERRAGALARALVPHAVAATGIPHLAPQAAEPVDDAVDLEPDAVSLDEGDERVDDEPPWRRGRAGTAIGRAVHAVLQTVDLATGEGSTGLAAAQAAAEGVPDLATVIEQRVRSVLDSPSVKAAVATGKYWREVFVAVPVGERVLEGFIDLLYEDPDGELVVVDYKTDGVRNEAEADEAVGRYRLQAAAYALAVSRSLSRPVARCVFVFANPTRWFERELSDLANARGEVEVLLTSG